MRILILGAGGIGGYFGTRLEQGGSDVTFLVRPQRAQSLRESGLRLKSPLGDATIWPKLLVAGDPMPDFDLVLLSSKAYDLGGAIDAIAPAVGPGTFVLPLLNGMAHIDTLDARFGRDRVLGGVAHVSVTLAPGGEILHLAPVQRIIAGARGGHSADPVLSALQTAAASAQFDFTLSAHIMQDLWEKWVFIATLAASTCTMRAPVGAIMATDAGERFILDLLAECEEVAGENGHAPAPDRTATYRAMLTERGSPIAASMLRDIERGGPTEGPHVIGDLVARARTTKVPVPLLEIAWAHLQAYESQRTRPHKKP